MWNLIKLRNIDQKQACLHTFSCRICPNDEQRESEAESVTAAEEKEAQQRLRVMALHQQRKSLAEDKEIEAKLQVRM